MPSRFRFTCLVPSEDQTLQRVALLVQKYLFNIGVDMDVELQPQRDIARRVATGEFEAVLSEFAATRSLSFVYAFWHSPGESGGGLLGLPYHSADAALDRLRSSLSEADVRSAVADLQRAFYDDPPAVFLDWSERSHALSRNIEVSTEPGRDIMGNIRQWRPVTGRSARR